MQKSTFPNQDMETTESAMADPWPLIPAGIYEAVCINSQKSKYLGKERRLYLHYQITSGEYFNTIIFQSFNNNYKSFPMASKYYIEWSLANRALPKRRDKMSPDVFLKKAYRVKVTTVRRKYSDGTFMPEMFNYSKVDRIVEVLT